MLNVTLALALLTEERLQRGEAASRHTRAAEPTRNTHTHTSSHPLSCDVCVGDHGFTRYSLFSYNKKSYSVCVFIHICITTKIHTSDKRR